MSTPDIFEPPRSYQRFSVSDRVQHATMVISFLVLVATGLPQKYIYANYAFLDGLIDLMGGLETVRLVHRWAATVLMLVTVYHVMATAHRVLVRRVPLHLLPRYQDLLDAVQAVRYNLGLARERPRGERYTWEEKVEYWSLAWGTIVMIATGFMLWNPVATARFLPGQWIPAAQVIHGGEALLAILAVLVWAAHYVAFEDMSRIASQLRTQRGLREAQRIAKADRQQLLQRGRLDLIGEFGGNSQRDIELVGRP